MTAGGQIQNRVKEIRFRVEPVTDRVKVEREQFNQEWVASVVGIWSCQSVSH